jgi:hypothetical protein
MSEETVSIETDRERTIEDKSWFVLTKSLTLTTRFMIYSFWLGIGYNLRRMLLDAGWNGSPGSTAGVMVGLMLCVLVSELACWAAIDGLEWVLACIEEIGARPAATVDDDLSL